jgi:hypothetical protein
MVPLSLKVFQHYVFQSVTFDSFAAGFIWSIFWNLSIPYSPANASLNYLSYVNIAWCCFNLINCLVCYHFLLNPNQAAFSMYVGTMFALYFYIILTGGVSSPFLVDFVLVALALSANAPRTGYSIVYAFGFLILLTDFFLPMKFPIPEDWRYTVYVTNFIFILLLFYIKYIPYFLQRASYKASSSKKTRGVFYNGSHILSLDYTQKVGNGSYGKVYRGIYKGENVAVKEITIVAPEKNQNTEQKAYRNIEREISILGSLSSPYIVRYIGMLVCFLFFSILFRFVSFCFVSFCLVLFNVC